ncbi:hypothetical protein GGR56DRAFT_688291 [Xylariaceae sp. FL0804]|nr:hypothetical protein GGR56DRAFT_688291 [Xylariaceae sp. FL0804]
MANHLITTLGLAPIHIACLNGHYAETVSLIAEDRANLEAADFQERTPIVFATLMGHLPIVELLNKKGADTTKIHEFVGENGATDLCRILLSSSRVGEEYHDAEKSRRAIAQRFSEPDRMRMAHNVRRGAARIAKKGSDIIVYTPVFQVNTGYKLNKHKSIGALTVEGSSEVLMAAHSGYEVIGKTPQEGCLDVRKWNDIALTKVAPQIGFSFKGHQNDNGAKPREAAHTGRFHAGHVEVLLASWYAVELARQCNPGRTEEWCVQHLRSVHHADDATLPKPQRHAIIFIDRDPCNVCQNLLRKLYEYTRVTFSIRACAGVGPRVAVLVEDGNNSPRGKKRVRVGYSDSFDASDGPPTDTDDEEEAEAEAEEAEEAEAPPDHDLEARVEALYAAHLTPATAAAGATVTPVSDAVGAEHDNGGDQGEEEAVPQAAAAAASAAELRLPPDSWPRSAFGVYKRGRVSPREAWKDTPERFKRKTAVKEDPTPSRAPAPAPATASAQYRYAAIDSGSRGMDLDSSSEDSSDSSTDDARSSVRRRLKY